MISSGHDTGGRETKGRSAGLRAASAAEINNGIMRGRAQDASSTWVLQLDPVSPKKMLHQYPARILITKPVSIHVPGHAVEYGVRA